jgi:hypothetical protein
VLAYQVCEVEPALEAVAGVLAIVGVDVAGGATTVLEIRLAAAVVALAAAAWLAVAV